MDPPHAAAEGDPVPAPEPHGSGVARRARRWLRRAQPWVSLAVGVAGALVMDRGLNRAGWVAGATVALWLTLTSLHWASRNARQVDPAHRLRRGALAAARHSSLMLTQSIAQSCLFFALPFYYRAAALELGHTDPGHAVFLLALGGLCTASLWDPWTERWLERPLLGALLPAAASFAALNVVLPGVGLSTHLSLWLAALSSTIGALSVAVTRAPRERKRRLFGLAACAALTVPLSLWLGAARLVPPAPLRLARAELGTALDGKWITEPVTRLKRAPERLICATAIEAPLGLRDRLYHVWDLEGRELARMELEVVGGRREGYRTRSWLRDFAHRSAGRYGCSVQTASGQVLGKRHAWIGSP